MLSVLVALMYVVESTMQRDIEQFSNQNIDLLEKQGEISSRTVEQKLKDFRKQMQAIASNYFLVTELNSYGKLDNMPDDLFVSLEKFLPDVQGLFLVNEDGDQFGSDDELELGQACLSDIENSTHSLHQQDGVYQAILHPQPGRLHFDMMFPVTVLEQKLLFFASFDVALLQSLLADYQLTSDQVFLVQTAKPKLIEIGVDIARGSVQFSRDSFLSEAELALIGFQRSIKGSAWDLIVINDPSVVLEYTKQRQSDAYIQAVVILVLWIAILLVGLFYSANQLRFIDKLKNMSHTDPLTGLANRRTLEKELNKSIARHQRLEIYSGLLFLDLNDFKPINDKYGHDVGDEVLKLCADRLQDLIRVDDLVVRLGGDEFIVLLNGLAKSEPIANMRLQDSVNRYELALAEPYNVNGVELNCFVSIGCAMIDGSTDNVDEIIKVADNHMYEIKKLKKNNNTPSVS